MWSPHLGAWYYHAMIVDQLYYCLNHCSMSVLETGNLCRCLDYCSSWWLSEYAIFVFFCLNYMRWYIIGGQKLKNMKCLGLNEQPATWFLSKVQVFIESLWKLVRTMQNLEFFRFLTFWVLTANITISFCSQLCFIHSFLRSELQIIYPSMLKLVSFCRVTETKWQEA